MKTQPGVNLTQLLLTLTPVRVLSVLTTIVTLLLTQGLIQNNTEKLVTGLAAVFVPTVITLIHEIVQAINGHAVALSQIAAAQHKTVNITMAKSTPAGLGVPPPIK